jgi:hypothetical protein
MRRILVTCMVLLGLTAARADALTVRDVIELSKAGVGDPVLLALIEVDHPVFTLNTDTLKALKEAGVSDQVMIAMIHSGRTRPPAAPAQEMAAPDTEPIPPPADGAPSPQAQVIVIDHHEEQPAPREVAVPVFVPVPVFPQPTLQRQEHVTRIVNTDDGGLVKIREAVPFNCTKAEPIYWGNGGKRRPGTWAPPPQIVCR